ncbi:hypothetical protein M513_00012 [Trichuris suis]|uniref:Uncharacterized protein n=1 Tax=Trichuris suis TaxID=68888 RepID=A0A085MNQ3_9BILA|nr:hypothetical protein M513_00012 [Trichuris suis]
MVKLLHENLWNRHLRTESEGLTNTQRVIQAKIGSLGSQFQEWENHEGEILNQKRS